MIESKNFVSALEKSDVRFVTGVPDSLLKDVCAYITTHFPQERHIIATNEGSAIGLAIGHYLASKRPALVYMQNSGLGNIINPMTSLVDPQVYGIPMVLMVGWRGEINTDGKQMHDEPQHVKQGQVTLGQLDLLDVPYVVIDASSNIESVIQNVVDMAIKRSGPVAMVVRKQTFASFKLTDAKEEGPRLKREEVIQTVLSCLPKDLPIVATTGMASRELFEIRKATESGHHRDFLTVGGMGHASQIAAGIALARPQSKVVCLDGDGALLMHMGGLAITSALNNYLHIVINNGAHDSVGGQPTKAAGLDLTTLARDFGYKTVGRASTREEIKEKIASMLNANGSVFLEITCKTGARSDLGRPDRTPAENKADFMKFLQGEV